MYLLFQYRYYLSEDPSLTKKNKDESYTIVIVNGYCEKYSDENIKISNLDDDNNKYFNNKLSNKNDFFIDLNSLFLNSGFKLEVKKNKKIRIKIYNIVSEENLTIFQRNYFSCSENSNVELIEEFENKNNSINNVYNVLDIKNNSKHFKRL